MYPIRVYDKGGKLFRKYTEDTLRTIYSTSPLGANYEVSVLIEGLVFMALLTYYAFQGRSIDYFEFVYKKRMPALGDGLRILKDIDIFDDSVIKEIEKYKILRNDFIHDPFKMKTMHFNDNSVGQSLELLFEQGIKTLELLSPLVTPAQPSVDEWRRRYKAVVSGDTLNINLGEIFKELDNKRKQ